MSSYKKGDKLAPLASSTGDAGLMQLNRITGRSLYDLKGLNGDSAPMETRAQKFCIAISRATRFRKEDAQKNRNLALATYSAYNAGPGGLARYRGVRQTPVWKKVDHAFWPKFQTVSSGKELAVKDCYTN